MDKLNADGKPMSADPRSAMSVVTMDCNEKDPEPDSTSQDTCGTAGSRCVSEVNISNVHPTKMDVATISMEVPSLASMDVEHKSLAALLQTNEPQQRKFEGKNIFDTFASCQTQPDLKTEVKKTDRSAVDSKVLKGSSPGNVSKEETERSSQESRPHPDNGTSNNLFQEARIDKRAIPTKAATTTVTRAIVSPLIPMVVYEQRSDDEDGNNTDTEYETINEEGSRKDISSPAPSILKLTATNNREAEKMVIRYNDGMESDADMTSDSDDRLVVDSDCKAEDDPGSFRENRSDTDTDEGDDEIMETSPKSLEKVEPLAALNMLKGYRLPMSKETLTRASIISEDTHSSKDSDIPLTVPVSVPKSIDTTTVQTLSLKKAPTEQLQPRKASPENIPSVVSDMALKGDLKVRLTHHNGKRAAPIEYKSLPPNFPHLLPSSISIHSGSGSLLKRNTPVSLVTSTMDQTVTGTHKILTLQPPGSIKTESGTPSSVDHVDRIGFDSVNSQEKPQTFKAPDAARKLKASLSLQLNSDSGHTASVLMEHGDASFRKPTGSLISPMQHATDDSFSSEEQVRSILKKYNVFGSGEKREVSVKDMRRVIPQLIMCLFSKDDHHSRKVKGLWERKPHQWPDQIPYCDPNNSNRGGKGGGKPKKETLHTMFEFLLSQYLQKYKDKAGPLHPTPDTKTPDHCTLHNTGILQSPASVELQNANLMNQLDPIAQPPIAIPSQTSKMIPLSSVNIATANKKVALIGTADLRDMLSQVPSHRNVPRMVDAANRSNQSQHNDFLNSGFLLAAASAQSNIVPKYKSLPAGMTFPLPGSNTPPTKKKKVPTATLR